MLQHFNKNSRRANHGTESFIILEQIRLSYFPKRLFFEKKSTTGLTTVSNRAMSFQKNHHRANHKNKVA